MVSIRAEATGGQGLLCGLPGGIFLPMSRSCSAGICSSLALSAPALSRLSAETRATSGQLPAASVCWP